MAYSEVTEHMAKQDKIWAGGFGAVVVALRCPYSAREVPIQLAKPLINVVSATRALTPPGKVMNIAHSLCLNLQVET